MFQTKIKSSVAPVLRAFGKTQFPGSKENKQIIKKGPRVLGHQSLGDTLVKEHFDNFLDYRNRDIQIKITLEVSLSENKSRAKKNIHKVCYLVVLPK